MMVEMKFLGLVVAVLLAACGGDTKRVPGPDGGPCDPTVQKGCPDASVAP